MSLKNPKRVQTQTASIKKKKQSTVIQDTLKIGQKYSTFPRAQERVSARASERVSAAERASERVSAVERASEVSSAEQANE